MSGWCDFAERVAGVTTWAPGNSGRVGFCDHVASGFIGTMRNPQFWNNAGVSAHFCIGRNGDIIQLVNIFDTAFAQGKLGPRVAWPPYEQMRTGTGTGNPNAWLISTEHEGFPGEPWTPEMYASDLQLKRWCVAESRMAGEDALRFGLDSLAGHYMFDGVNRASCPGPTWPRAQLFADLTREEDDMSAEDKAELERLRHDRLAPQPTKEQATDALIKAGGIIVAGDRSLGELNLTDVLALQWMVNTARGGV